MKLTGTFLDEISHDIPHQNWGKQDWDADFSAMQKKQALIKQSLLSFRIL